MNSFLKKLLISSSNAVSVQAFRYVFVGGAATVADMGVLYIMTRFAHIYYLVSAALGFVIGLTVNYLLSIKWVFASRKLSSRTSEFMVFALVGIIGLGITELIMLLGVGALKTHYMLVKAAAVLIVFAWNFGVRRALLFRGE